jgi:drug/metabolite transporter (DMT)-like permease
MRDAMTTLPGAMPARRASALGIAAGLAAAVIWGATLAMTRLGVASNGDLGAQDLVLLRFAAPALLLLPVAWRTLPRLHGRQIAALAVMLVGGGAPFLLLVGSALRDAGAAEAGALLPGTLPLWVTAASLLAGRSRTAPLTPSGGTGLALMALAVLVVAGPASLEGGLGDGTLLLLLAGWLSAAYTIALRHARLGALEATALVSLGSVLGFLPFYALAPEPGLTTSAWQEIALHLAWQGGLSGLAAPIAFAAAVARLGIARAAAFAALSPVAAAVFGLLLSGEWPDGLAALGMVSATLGVALANQGARRAD